MLLRQLLNSIHRAGISDLYNNWYENVLEGLSRPTYICATGPIRAWLRYTEAERCMFWLGDGRKHSIKNCFRFRSVDGSSVVMLKLHRSWSRKINTPELENSLERLCAARSTMLKFSHMSLGKLSYFISISELLVDPPRFHSQDDPEN